MKYLFLGGGYDSIIFIKKLQSRGIDVLLVDYNEKPVAADVVEKFYRISTLNRETVLNLASQHQVDQILTACTDQALLTMAYVSEKLGTYSYLSYHQALNVTNKLYMKNRMLSSGIPTAPACFLHSPLDIDLIKPSKWPVVVKPVDCNSSKGVRKVMDVDECKDAVKKALAFSRCGVVIVETYLKGKEISVDIWLNGQKPIVIGISQTNKISGKDSFTITQSIYPAEISKKAFEQIKKIAADIARSFDLANMPLLLQMVVDNDTPYVIEFSPRMGGGTKYRFIEEMSGVNIVDIYLDMTIGRTVTCPTTLLRDVVMHFNYIYTKPCTYMGSNFSQLKESGIINDFFQYKSVGTLIDKAEISGDRVLGVIIKASDYESLFKKESAFLQKAEVYDESGRDVMLRGIYQ